MATQLQSGISVSPPASADIDFDAVAGIVNAAVDEQVTADNARFEERAQMEEALWRPRYENALAAGLIPEPDEMQVLTDLDQADTAERRQTADDLGDGLGVLRQPLPVTPHLPNLNQWASPPYHSGHGEGTQGPVIHARAFSNNGWVEMWPQSSLGTNWAWGRCSLTQLIVKKSSRINLDPVYLFHPRGHEVSGWSFFSPARFQADAYLTVVNAKTGDRWADKTRILDTKRGMLGCFREELPVGGPLYVLSQGTAAPGDYVVLTATIVTRVAVPIGHASFLFSGIVNPFAIA